MSEALRAARRLIAADRMVVYECHVSPVDGKLDADGQEMVDDYDTVLRQIDAELAELPPDCNAARSTDYQRGYVAGYRRGCRVAREEVKALRAEANGLHKQLDAAMAQQGA